MSYVTTSKIIFKGEMLEIVKMIEMIEIVTNIEMIKNILLELLNVKNDRMHKKSILEMQVKSALQDALFFWFYNYDFSL